MTRRRTYIAVLAITFISINLTAQNIGKVVIRNSSNANPPFIVSLNGIRLNNLYSNTTSFDFLDDYNYRVKILQAGTINVLNYNITSAPNYVSVYELNKDPYGNYALILESKSLLSNQTTTISPNTSTVIVTPTVVSTPTIAPVTPTVSNVISNTDFSAMCQTIKNEGLSSTRLEMAKSIFDKLNLTSSQVLDVMYVLSLEKHKLDFAKYAYSRVSDKQNFYKVYNGFGLSSSKKEMTAYIKNNP